MRWPRISARRWWRPQGPFGRPWDETEYSIDVWIPVYPRRWIHWKLSYLYFPTKQKDGSYK